MAHWRKAQILVVEDSEDLRDLLVGMLQGEFEVLTADSLKSAKYKIQNLDIRLVLLDLGLPDGSGFELFSVAQSMQPSIPTFVVSGNDDTAAKVTSFSLGADDFITKPFNSVELMARIKAKIKKSEKMEGPFVAQEECGFILDPATLKAFSVVGSERRDLDLSPLEFKLFSLFLNNQTRVYSRSQLINRVYGESIAITPRAIDNHICSLRKKLGDRSRCIQTIYGNGFRFVYDQESQSSRAS